MPSIATAIQNNLSRIASGPRLEPIAREADFPSVTPPNTAVSLPTRGTFPPTLILGPDFQNATRVYRQPQSVGVRTPTFPFLETGTAITGTTSSTQSTTNTTTVVGNILLETNGTPTTSQNILNLIQGSGILIQSANGGVISFTNLGFAPFSPMLCPPVITPPVTGTLTWGNQGTAAYAYNAGGGLYFSDSAAPTTIPILYKTAPSTPWTLVVGFVLGSTFAATASGTAGLVLRESATNKLITFFQGPAWNQLGATLGSSSLEINKYTSYTAFQSTYLTQNSPCPPIVWMSVTDNGTNLIFATSIDGQNFKTVLQKLRTDFFTTAPNQVGIGLNPQSSSGVCDAVFVHWSGV